MMKINKETIKAFSLVETLLYIAIVSVVVVALVSFLSVSQVTAKRNQTVNEVEQQGAQIMQQITQTLRNATSVTSPTAGTTAAAITVVVPTGGNSPTVFNLSSGVLQITEGAGAAVPLSSNRVTISALSFFNLKPGTARDSIKIQFTVTYNNTSGKQETNYAQTFYGTATLR